MIRLVKNCAILLIVAAVLVYGGLAVASLVVKPATASGVLSTSAGITVTGTEAVQ